MNVSFSALPLTVIGKQRMRQREEPTRITYRRQDSRAPPPMEPRPSDLHMQWPSGLVSEQTDPGSIAIWLIFLLKHLWYGAQSRDFSLGCLRTTRIMADSHCMAIIVQSQSGGDRVALIILGVGGCLHRENDTGR